MFNCTWVAKGTECLCGVISGSLCNISKSYVEDWARRAKCHSQDPGEILSPLHRVKQGPKKVKYGLMKVMGLCLQFPSLRLPVRKPYW